MSTLSYLNPFTRYKILGAQKYLNCLKIYCNYFTFPKCKKKKKNECF